MPLTPLYRQKNAVNAAIFSVKRRQRLYTDKKTPLTPLFFRLNAVNAFIPTKNAVNAAIFPVKRR